MIWLGSAAAICAAVQAYFAYREWFGWGVPFVNQAAKAWLDPKQDPQLVASHVAWAGPMARNLAAYNFLLALALALAWTSILALREAALALPFAILLGLFLLGAAAAAGYTKVYAALAAQGVLAVLLLGAVWLTWPGPLPV